MNESSGGGGSAKVPAEMVSGYVHVSALDERYLALIRGSLRVCLNYKPAFGHGKGDGISLERFQQMYREDEFYSWFGLDSPLVYAAHKAAGGMTSVYRQIGLSCQLVFQNVLQDTLGLSAADATWSYTVKAKGAKTRTLALDWRFSIPTPAARAGARAERKSASEVAL